MEKRRGKGRGDERRDQSRITRSKNVRRSRDTEERTMSMSMPMPSGKMPRRVVKNGKGKKTAFEIPQVRGIFSQKGVWYCILYLTEVGEKVVSLDQVPLELFPAFEKYRRSLDERLRKADLAIQLISSNGLRLALPAPEAGGRGKDEDEDRVDEVDEVDEVREEEAKEVREEEAREARRERRPSRDHITITSGESQSLLVASPPRVDRSARPPTVQLGLIEEYTSASSQEPILSPAVRPSETCKHRQDASPDRSSRASTTRGRMKGFNENHHREGEERKRLEVKKARLITTLERLRGADKGDCALM